MDLIIKETSQHCRLKINSIESDIKSMQKSDAHAERFAREELNLIYEDEQYLNFKENDSNEPQS